LGLKRGGMREDRSFVKRILRGERLEIEKTGEGKKRGGFKITSEKKKEMKSAASMKITNKP